MAAMFWYQSSDKCEGFVKQAGNLWTMDGELKQEIFRQGIVVLVYAVDGGVFR